MINCPKCGRNKISGPFYRGPQHLVPEMLKFICRTCGFVSYERTFDATPPAPAPTPVKEG
jgi:rubredoxin